MEGYVERWDKTGLLGGLPEEDRPKFAQLFQNQADYSLKTFKALTRRDQVVFFNIQFPLVRRLFESLNFEWDVVDSPCFLFEDEGCSVRTEKFISHHTLKEPEISSSYMALDFAVEVTENLAEQFSQELNEKYRGKHVFFLTPLVALGEVQGEEGVLKLGYRAKAV